jgi:hypothetical protein
VGSVVAGSSVTSGSAVVSEGVSVTVGGVSPESPVPSPPVVANAVTGNSVKTIMMQSMRLMILPNFEAFLMCLSPESEFVPLKLELNVYSDQFDGISIYIHYYIRVTL